MKRLNNVEFCRHLLLHPNGHVAGLDFGAKHIGIAVSDSSRNFVHPLGSLTRSRPGASVNSGAEILSKMGHLFKEKGYHNVSGIVIGLPLREGALTPFCREIASTVDIMGNLCTHPEGFVAVAGTEARSLMEYFPPVCTFWDEYNTTADAKETLSQLTSKRKVRMRSKDAVAAAVILQRFLEDPRIARLGVSAPPPETRAASAVVGRRKPTGSRGPGRRR
jgi:RNase H-fold protein (predicted Holliday junction resolvase)